MMYEWSWWSVLPMVGVILVITLVWLFVALTRSGALSGRTTGEDILRERLARGEIDSAEYAQSLDAFQDRRSTTSH